MKYELYKLLNLPLSKQVLAFEEIFIDYDKYTKWVEYIYESDCFPKIQQGLYPMLKYYGYSLQSINFWEIRDDLRSSMNLLKIEQPKGADAIKLYLYGYLQERISHINSYSESQLYDIILHMSEILDDEVSAFRPFLKIINKQIYDDLFPYYSVTEKKRDLIVAANSYIMISKISIYRKQGRYSISVNNN